MPAYLASRLIERYSNQQDTVFDPFCGSGVVPLEAARLGRVGTGTDLLRLAVEITQVALSLPNPQVIRNKWNSLHKQAMTRVSLFDETNHKETSKTESLLELSRWFHNETLIEIVVLREEITKINDESIHRLFKLLLASSLLSLSKRTSRGVVHWGWVADNVVPKENDLVRTNVFEEVDKRVKRLINFMKATGSHALQKENNSYILEHDWLKHKLPVQFEPNSAQLLLTSPPYPYSIDYVLALRLTHYFYEFPYTKSKSNEIGARYKRKRKQRGPQYLAELGASLNIASKLVMDGGYAVYVLPHPDQCWFTVELSIDGWLEFIKNSMSGNWHVEEYGFRDCIQRRLVHPSKAKRQEMIVAYQKIKS